MSAFVYLPTFDMFVQCMCGGYNVLCDAMDMNMFNTPCPKCSTHTLYCGRVRVCF